MDLSDMSKFEQALDAFVKAGEALIEADSNLTFNEIDGLSERQAAHVEKAVESARTNQEQRRAS